MKKYIFLFLLIVSIPAFAQFKYSAWNIGPQIGSFKITNGLARYAFNGPNPTDVYLADSADCKYAVTNLRFNVEGVRDNFFVKG